MGKTQCVFLESLAESARLYKGIQSSNIYQMQILITHTTVYFNQYFLLDARGYIWNLAEHLM